jgi:hypothetical protein
VTQLDFGLIWFDLRSEFARDSHSIFSSGARRWCSEAVLQSSLGGFTFEFASVLDQEMRIDGVFPVPKAVLVTALLSFIRILVAD